MFVTIEETRNKEIWVEASCFEEAIEEAERLYKDGLVDMRSGSEVHALVGDKANDFCLIAEWFC